MLASRMVIVAIASAFIHLCVALRPPPTFTLNLSAPAHERWRGALSLVLAAHSFESSFAPTFAAHNTTLFSKLTPKQFSALGGALQEHWPEHADEIRGITADFAATGHPGVSYEYLAAWVYFHALAHTPLLSATADTRECTALLARTADGGVLHIGNMDQSPMSLRNITLHVRFVHGDGTLAFEGVDWYWFTTGLSRAVKGGLGSLQENWRTSLRPTQDVINEIVAGAAVPQMFVFRNALLQSADFPALLKYVASVRLFAPFYVVAAGAGGEGHVLARNLSGIAGEDVLPKHATSAAANSSSWFLVQTNYDHWKVDPESDPRRTHAEQTLRGIGAAVGATELGLYAAASTYPVHNPHTAFTALMDPKTGAFKAFVRDALCPVPGSALESSDSRYCQAA